jgi:hypothetical protein
LAAANAAVGPKLIGYTLMSALRALLSTSLLAGAAVCIGACVADGDDPPAESDSYTPRLLILLGATIIATAVLPMALSDYTPTPINHQNRLNQALLLGVVLMLAAHLSSARGRGAVFAASTVAVVFLAAHAHFATIWAESARRQNLLRELVTSQIDAWPARTTLLVLLPERYVDEKVPVFDAHWDISGAVQVWTGDPNRWAAVIRPDGNYRCTPSGLSTGGAIAPYSSFRLLDASVGRIEQLGSDACRRLQNPG